MQDSQDNMLRAKSRLGEGYAGWISAIAVGLLILLAAFLLRMDRLYDRYPNEIVVGGSAMEYQMLAQHFLQPEEVPPPGNPVGLALVLAGLFAVMPFAHSVTQVAITIALGLAIIPLGYVLARRFVGKGWAVVAGTLIAVNSTMASNSARGTTEELYAVGLLIVILLFLRLRKRIQASHWEYAVLGRLCPDLS